MSRIKTTEQFIADAVAVHGDKYGYDKVEYTGNNKKVIISCKEHGDWTMTPINHLRGQNCPECGKRIGIEKLTIFKRNSAQELLKRKFEGLIQPEEYKLIPLTQGKFAKVDNEDFEYLSQFNWYYKEGYAVNDKLGLMHRYIMNAPNGMDVDHIVQENKSDNRRSNLRLATGTQNARNSRPTKNSTSDYKGVSWCKKRSVWRANIYINSKQTHLGYFNNEENAGRAYDLKALECWGEFAYLNFPELKDEYFKNKSRR